MSEKTSSIFKRLLKNLTIRIRLIFLFVLQVTIILFLIGFYLRWQMRNILEQELARTLKSVAMSISAQLEADLVVNLLPGDEASRTYHTLQSNLVGIANATGMKRIYIFKADGTSLVDTQSNVPVGNRYYRLQFNAVELQQVFSGNTVSSLLFEGFDGMLYKTGFAPIFRGESVVAAIGVDGSAQTLEAVHQIERNLLSLGMLGVAISIGLAFFFANRITIPLKKLEKSAREIGRGNLQQAIIARGYDEVAFLAKTLEEMRWGILQRDRRQMMMLAGVAHEIRNPLGGIELFAGLLRDDLLDKDQQIAAQKILLEVRNLKTIIQGFLDWAKPKPAQKVVCKIKTIFDDAYCLLGTGVESAKITYIEHPADISLYIDPQHLKQILLNLMQNALQAARLNCQIEIRAEKLEERGIVEIKIKDNGTGIPENVQQQIFEPFFTTHKDGTGLGLAVVKNLVEENSGRIELTVSSPSGSEFAICFPIDI
ncbi:HAMP domain-containing protein [candidate division KSB1 bacterium]|nr:HAMP domain-containing protein [candidate division KSB1 bacterium]